MNEKIILKRSPNIAFLKYWGKLEGGEKNLPCNPSLSMTLSKAFTQVEFLKVSGSQKKLWIQGELANDLEQKKVFEFLNLLAQETQCTKWEATGLEIRSENNFPTGAGIASSASAYAALCDGFLEFFSIPLSIAERSRLARQGSGSACRSVGGPYMKWTHTFAEELNTRWKLYDTILIVDDTKKEISSREGHRRALLSPYFNHRQLALPNRLKQMELALAEKKLQVLGPLLEQEALDMHMIAMTSLEPIFYLKPNSWALIEALRKIPNRNVYFTIDAGPNLHLISENRLPWISDWLKGLNISAKIWEDECQ